MTQKGILIDFYQQIWIVVSSVQENSLAYNASIFPRDVILQVNGKDVYYGHPVPLISGKKNSLLVHRSGKNYKKSL